MNFNFFIILIFLMFLLLYKIKEGFTGWGMYRQSPLGNIHTGSNPLSYYEHHRYRKPYNYPACHMKDYPVRHCAHFD